MAFVKILLIINCPGK